jgi:predicted alpha/beta superfamily hydrolase
MFAGGAWQEGARMISNDESPLPDTEVHYLRSEHVGDEFKILIGHCGSSDSGPPPVLFVSDAACLFGTAVEIVRLLNMMEHLPPLLVVGIGYRVATIQETLELRNRDFTPTVDPNLTGTATWSLMGGASNFLGFLRDELGPWVRERYGVDPHDSAFFGNSSGGIFATYALLSEPSTFRRYGIGSPGLWYDSEDLFEREADYARAHDDLQAKVFFSVGAYENPDKSDSEVDLVAYTERMVAVLRGRSYPSLEIECEVQPGEYHPTAPPLNLSRSLRYLFNAPR